MKELSIEEKARRYNEAIERGKQIQNTPYIAHWDIMKEVAEHLLPELAESEDERMRKEITELVMQPTWKTEKEFHRRKELVAWLEKKSEQKPTDNEMIEILRAEYEKGRADAIVEMQKSAWSEEDEVMFRKAIITIDNVRMNAEFLEYYQDISKWLESLKDRVQPKQEWCEEDEQTFIESVEALEDFGKFELADWLKEHKNKFLSSKSHWKPSDEQMEYLSKAILTLGNEGDCKTASILNELRTNLKKLKG